MFARILRSSMILLTFFCLCLPASNKTKIVTLFFQIFLQGLYHVMESSFVTYRLYKGCYIILMTGYTIFIILNFSSNSLTIFVLESILKTMPPVTVFLRFVCA